MVALIGGGALVVASILYLALKLVVSYHLGASPETSGGVPTLDAVIFPPIFGTYGAWLATRELNGVGLTFWGAAALWLGLTFVVGLALSVAFAAGGRRRRAP